MLTLISVLALFFVLFFLLNLTKPLAWAETNEINDEPDEFQLLIEQSSQKYEEANSEAQQLMIQISDNEKRVDEINVLLPQQQKRADSSLRKLYDLSNTFGVLINMILGVENVADAIKSYNYLEHVRDKNVSEVASLTSMKVELEALQADLTLKKETAQTKAQEAQVALKQAQDARLQAQKKAQEQAKGEKATIEAEAKQSSDNQSSSSSQESNTTEQVVSPTNDGADWTSDKTSFVNSWTARIDAYLSGSPLAGQGKVFAEAAWDFGVDPRWSPAISYTESSKGRYCFHPYNAWGWGSVSWDSWYDAIRAHVKGLANGYGYTISEAAAKKYCPPNWLHWYNTTSAQMNLI